MVGEKLGRALILAAGRGRRLVGITAAQPKCLVPLAGRSLLDWQLQALATSDIDQVAIVGGYRREQLCRPGITMFENVAWPSTNMVASLRVGEAWLRAAPCLVAYGDIVYHPRIVAALVRCDADIAISYDVLWRSLWEVRFDRPQDDAESLRVARGRVLEIGSHGASLERIEGQFMGLLRITPRGWSTIDRYLSDVPEGDAAMMDMTTLLQQLVAAGVRIGAVPVRGRWCEVDSPSDLTLYERMTARDSRWAHDWRP